jgi:hypothetical protein
MSVPSVPHGFIILFVPLVPLPAPPAPTVIVVVCPLNIVIPPGNLNGLGPKPEAR